MINTVMLVGRLTRNPEMLECDNGNKVSRITLAVNRKFKNADGLYTTDFIDCILWNNTAKHLNDYCKKGDLIGIRGRVQINNYEKEGQRRKDTVIIGETITFLSSNKSLGLEEEEN